MVLTKEKISLLYRLNKKGYKNRYIAYRLNISDGTVSRYIKSRKLGFNSPHEYKKHEYTINQKKQRNQELGRLIAAELEKREKSYSWLAEKIGKKRATISLYVHGKIYPDNKTLRRICSAFRIKYKSLDDILKV
ncbi:helix-turn-helix domain-containing protein [Candidatus Woesearchaeota archaeon]|nr:helix-turn-helix domain-containing protein [Candidatus Woesearchaeota archaeon]